MMSIFQGSILKEKHVKETIMEANSKQVTTKL